MPQNADKTYFQKDTNIHKILLQENAKFAQRNLVRKEVVEEVLLVIASSSCSRFRARLVDLLGMWDGDRMGR